jgi:hypothetical protein
MRRVVAAFAWFFTAVAAAVAMEPEARGRIGDLTYDATRWEVRKDGDAFDVLCRSKGCDAAMTMRVLPADTPACTRAALMAASALARDGSFRTIHRSGFDIVAAVGWTGCRNARPPSVHACAVYKGRAYRFDSPVYGCSGGPGFSNGALDFLEQLGAE